MADNGDYDESSAVTYLSSALSRRKMRRAYAATEKPVKESRTKGNLFICEDAVNDEIEKMSNAQSSQGGTKVVLVSENLGLGNLSI